MSTKSKLLSAGAAGLACGALAGGFALASSSPTVKTASNASLGETIVVDGHGRTVYELRPETSHHLLCKKADGCFGPWPPLTVKSKKARLLAGHGVKGKLSVLHHDGVWQVALSGHPLYRFAGSAPIKLGAATSNDGPWTADSGNPIALVGKGPGQTVLTMPAADSKVILTLNDPASTVSGVGFTVPSGATDTGLVTVGGVENVAFTGGAGSAATGLYLNGAATAHQVTIALTAAGATGVV